MADFQYIERVEYMLKRLLKNESINTKEVADFFDVDVRLVRDDLNKRIKPLFPNTIKKMNNRWYADKDLISNQFFESDELLMISLLHTVTKDLNPKFYEKTIKLFKSLHQKASDAIYKHSSIEDILETHEQEFHLIKDAIENNKQIFCKHKDKHKNVNPIQIVNLEDYWYLIAYDLEEKDLRTFYFKDIKEIKITETSFKKDNYDFLGKLDYAINAFFKINKSNKIELELNLKSYSVLNRKKLNPSQRIYWNEELQNAIMYITVSDIMEIAPLVQQWIPNIKVIHPPELQTLIATNIKNYEI